MPNNSQTLLAHLVKSSRLQAKKLLIKGGTVVNEDRKFLSDVYCEDGIIR